MNKNLFFSWVILIVLNFGCANKISDSTSSIQEAAQQIGDLSASIDEAGGSSGTLAMMEESHRKFFSRSEPRSWLDFSSKIIPNANASTCVLAPGFGACSSNVITRTFGNCSIGSAVFSGTVTLTWSGGSAANCAMGAVNDMITRVPAFSVTGVRGYSLTVSKSGTIGQRITWASGSGVNKVFNFTNDGIRRVLTSPAGATVFDFISHTTSAITISGTQRSNRVVNGGTLRVTNNTTGTTCDYSPSAVSWSSTCNCPVSGSWTATCSDGKTSTLTHTSCGVANFTLGSDSESVTFDRCFGS